LEGDNMKLTISLSLALAAVLFSGCRPENMSRIGGYPKPPPVADADTKPPFDDTARLKDHPEGIPLPDPSVRANWVRNREIFKKDTVYFDFDSSTIKSSEKKKVANVAEYMKKNPGNGLEVEGHCDERGTDGYNRSLGERRALALREELARHGVDAMMIDTVSYGKDHPAVQGHDESAYKKNRRGEFLLEVAPGKTQ
jgi:peptidoglycan-associated lipoprotein